MANANQVIVNGETILDLRSDTVTPETLQKGYTAHDKSGTKITGTLEASSVSVQPSKSVIITSNGTATITPDAGYDALSSVDVTVDVASGGGSVSTVTINCEASDSYAFWLSPDGVFHKTKLNAGANTIIVAMYSPIGVYNVYSYTLTNRNNIVDSGSTLLVTNEQWWGTESYRIYYATASTASATQPTD